MSEVALTPFTTAGVPTEEFAALLEKGRVRGFLTPDDLMSVLERVELSSDLLEAVRGRVQAEGIALVAEIFFAAGAETVYTGVAGPSDPAYNLVTSRGRNTPAPWVPCRAFRSHSPGSRWTT